MRIARDSLLRTYWIASLCALTFAYGVGVGLFKIYPYELLQSLAYAGRELAQHPRHTLRMAPGKYLVESPPDGHSSTPATAASFPGITLVSGFFEGSNGIRLFGADGTLLNEWRISYNAIWPDARHLGDQPHDWDTELHGSMLLPTGDVVFTFQYGGLVRMDRCGRVRWKLPRLTHHEFVADADGNFWVPSRVERNEPLREFPKVPAPFQEERILKVSPTGKVLAEFSILEAIFDSGYEGVLFANGAHDSELEPPLSGDFTHLNKVEVLRPELAPAFPMFETGDMLVSLRNLDLLMVISPSTGRIKWSQTGPFLRQHDPDFLPSGQIAVFDNRRDGSGARRFGGSRILALDPATRRVSTLYGARSGEDFYTDTRGSQQPLDNGNLLISESDQGHAFEVDPAGTIVWSYVNRWKDGSVGKIVHALRYPDNYLDKSLKESCHDT